MSMITVLIIVFVLISLACYFLLPFISQGLTSRWSKSSETVATNIDALFIEKPKKWAKVVKISTAIVFMVLGFIFPNTFSGLDKLILDNAVRLNRQGYYQQTITLLSGVKRNVSPLMHNEMGVAYLGVNNVDDAITNFKRAIQLLPGYVDPHINLSTAYNIRGMRTDSEFALKRAEDLSKYNVEKTLIYGQDKSKDTTLLIRLISAFVFLIIGLKMPLWISNYLKKRRQKKFDDQLPDALKMMSNALKAGLNLPLALDMTVKQTKGPVHQELSLVLKEHKLGKSMNDAMMGLIRRVPSEDTLILVDTISLLSETGGNIPVAVENIANTIRERKRIKQKISAMTAEGRAQAIMLAIIPIAVGFIMNTLQKETFSLMYTTIIGLVCLTIMVVWGLIGIFFMWKTIQVKI